MRVKHPILLQIAVPFRIVFALVLTSALAGVAIPGENRQSTAGLDWWAFQTIKKPPVPASADVATITPIDAFVTDRLRSAGVQSDLPADRTVLIRSTTNQNFRSTLARPYHQTRVTSIPAVAKWDI